MKKYLLQTSDQLLMNWFRRGFARDLVPLSEKKGYAAFVEEARAFGKLGDVYAHVDQHFRHYLGASRSLIALGMKTFPAPTLFAVKHMLPISLHWLVGPAQATAEGIKIKKCKFLKSAGKKACVELCKKPTEDFFKNSLNIDAAFKPSFKSCSCQVILREK